VKRHVFNEFSIPVIIKGYLVKLFFLFLKKLTYNIVVFYVIYLQEIIDIVLILNIQSLRVSSKLVDKLELSIK